MQSINPKKIFLASYVLVNEEKKHPFQLKFDTWETIDSNVKIPGSPSPEWVNYTFQSHLYNIDFLHSESKVTDYLEYHFTNRPQKISEQDYLNALELWLWFDSKVILEGKKFQDRWVRSWIDEKKEKDTFFIPKENAQTNGNPKFTQVQLALYYYYLQLADIYPHFEKHPGKKLKAIEELTQKLGVSKMNFVQKYNLMAKHSERLSRTNIPNLEVVIDMLKDYPKAQEIAQNDLILAEERNTAP